MSDGVTAHTQRTTSSQHRRPHRPHQEVAVGAEGTSGAFGRLMVGSIAEKCDLAKKALFLVACTNADGSPDPNFEWQRRFALDWFGIRLEEPLVVWHEASVSGREKLYVNESHTDNDDDEARKQLLVELIFCMIPADKRHLFGTPQGKGRKFKNFRRCNLIGKENYRSFEISRGKKDKSEQYSSKDWAVYTVFVRTNLDAEVARLRAEIAELRQENRALLARLLDTEQLPVFGTSVEDHGDDDELKFLDFDAPSADQMDIEPTSSPASIPVNESASVAMAVALPIP